MDKDQHDGRPPDERPPGSANRGPSGTGPKTPKKYGEVLTTGQVARICNVAPRTVSKWFDTGQLRGYRIPGSKDRRIPLQHLVRFMKAHGMPLDELETGHTRILIVEPELELTTLIQQAMTEAEGYEVRVAGSSFEGGAVAESFQPHVMIVNVDLPGIEGRTLARFLANRPEMKGTQIIGMATAISEPDRVAFQQQGYHELLAKPFTIRQLIETVEKSLEMPRE